ncbi:MAG: MFS transporter, partial [Maribacter sp.]
MENTTVAPAANANRLFYGSCFALITTAFSFSLRAGVLPELGEAFDLTAKQLGEINSMWFFGFPIAMIIGGLTYHTIGPKKIMQFAFFSHILGIILTIYSGGYWGLILSTLLIGLGNGCTEAACNPMITDSTTGKKMNTLMNRFHMWFPGGLVLGSLISYFMIKANLGWQAQIWIILVPTLIYAFIFFGQKFPKPRVQEAATLKGNLKAMGSPIFLFIALCMA